MVLLMMTSTRVLIMPIKLAMMMRIIIISIVNMATSYPMRPPPATPCQPILLKRQLVLTPEINETRILLKSKWVGEPG